MTLTEARRRVLEVKVLALQGDFEAAHDAEDRLRTDTLREIRKAMTDDYRGPVPDTHRLAQLAAVALETEGIEFPRWAG